MILRTMLLLLVATNMLWATPSRAQSSFLAGVEAVDTSMQILPWYNGVITSIGNNFACISDPPILEIRVQGYAGFSLFPPNFTPAVGEVFYTHLVLSHPGNPCSGSAVGIELILPPGVTTATSANDPAFCFMVTGTSNQLIDLGSDSGYGCPQSYPQGLEGRAVIAPRGGLGGSGAWGMARGFWLEFLIPLRATQPQSGNTNITWRVNPDVGVVGYPRVPLFVNNEVIFRSAMEDKLLTLDICTISPTPAGC